MIKLVSEYNSNIDCFCKGDALGARILSTLKAYGTNHDFALFWMQVNEDDKIVSIISKIDNSITALCKDIDNQVIIDELKEFINVIGYDSASASENLSNQLFNNKNKTVKAVMQFNENLIFDKQVELTDIDLFDIYKLISTCHKLKVTKDSRDMFVADLSHKIRHGYADCYAVKKDDRYVSCALALAQTEKDVLLGGVATYDEHRKQGLARICIYELVRRNSEKNIFIFCKEDKVEFYKKLGFVRISNTAEVNI